MRMGVFLLGGVVGAVAAVYLSRNNPRLLSKMNIDQTIDKVGQFARTAKQMWDSTAIYSNMKDEPESQQHMN